MFLISCGADNLTSESPQETVHLSNPPTQEELCQLQSFLTGHGYVMQLDTLQLPNDFIQPIPNVLENCH
jgi:hypothetical protein